MLELILAAIVAWIAYKFGFFDWLSNKIKSNSYDDKRVINSTSDKEVKQEAENKENRSAHKIEKKSSIFSEIKASTKKAELESLSKNIEFFKDLTIKSEVKRPESTIESFCVSRGISSLVHFTLVENLWQILEHGLYGRKSLEERNFNYFYNDHYRLDYIEDGISMSIEFPNYKMFYKVRSKYPAKDWAVLVVDAKILNDMDCIYCKTNAASKSVTSIPVDQRKGIKALKEMFNENLQSQTRAESNTPDNYPTDPQAEVVIPGHIPKKYIKKIVFCDKVNIKNLDLTDQIVSRFSGCYSFVCDESMFRPRPGNLIKTNYKKE